MERPFWDFTPAKSAENPAAAFLDLATSITPEVSLSRR